MGGKALHLASLHFFANLPPLFSFSQLAVSMSCPRCLKSIIVSAGDFFGWLPSFSSLFWFLNCFWQCQPFLSTFYTPICEWPCWFFFSFGCFRQGLLAFLFGLWPASWLSSHNYSTVQIISNKSKKHLTNQIKSSII